MTDSLKIGEKNNPKLSPKNHALSFTKMHLLHPKYFFAN